MEDIEKTLRMQTDVQEIRNEDKPTIVRSHIQRKPVATFSPPSQPRSILIKLRARWTSLSRRNKIIFIAVITSFLALIIGLAAGLGSRKKGPQNLPLPSANGGPYSGDLTYYEPGLGACGVTSTDSDSIVAVSHYLFDAVSVGSNPNANPLCGKKIRAKRDNKSVDLTVVDRCVGCQPRDLDVTINTFGSLADVDLGRVTVEWSWLDSVPSNAGGS